MISGVEFSDSSLTYNTQCSSQWVSSLMPITHLTHLPLQQSSVCSLYLRVSYGLLPSMFFKIFLMFTYLWERENAHTSGLRAERGRHKIWSRLQGLKRQHRAQHGAGTQTHEIMTWAKAVCLPNWATQAPSLFLSYFFFPSPEYSLNEHNLITSPWTCNNYTL